MGPVERIVTLDSATLSLLIERGRVAVDEYQAEHGLIADDELAAVDRVWPAQAPTRARSSP